MIIYGLKNCDACRKALRANPGATLRDLRDAPLSAAERARFVAALGDKLINTRSATWRKLTEAERAASPESLIAAHPALIKRPVFETGGALGHTA
ncbi:arsenate reductase [Abyssibius alkaniclasticus]|uniref:ArsC/Spx/MgsR family protein n=1 Tax=Abyssibius alkaniclasticus TaxID=2881234 RepID=UPI00236454C6|nr:ArsC/Spx/MgsR family protein [Abyssibius alkaniclasticus]UPH72179.1 arsenate reductase [Abyssibius alkaniclasticus]